MIDLLHLHNLHHVGFLSSPASADPLQFPPLPDHLPLRTLDDRTIVLPNAVAQFTQGPPQTAKLPPFPILPVGQKGIDKVLRRCYTKEGSRFWAGMRNPDIPHA